jgi:two-component system, OmpR family, response regulator ChvI
MPRLLIVDDDNLFRESLSQNLADQGFEVRTVDRGEAALRFFADGGQTDLVLLDWKMPGINGIEVLKRLRDQSIDVPVIFLTVLTDQIYEESALKGGAVDYVEKSRSLSILLKRIELSLGRSVTNANAAPGGGDSLERFGALELQADSARAFWKGKPIDLTLTEFHMVRYLATRAGKDVRYRELYDLVHGEEFSAGQGPEGYRANVRAFIKRIRQKFRDLDPGFDSIENYPGFGYRWHNGEASAG